MIAEDILRKKWKEVGLGLLNLVAVVAGFSGISSRWCGSTCSRRERALWQCSSSPLTFWLQADRAPHPDGVCRQPRFAGMRYGNRSWLCAVRGRDGDPARDGHLSSRGLGHDQRAGQRTLLCRAGGHHGRDPVSRTSLPIEFEDCGNVGRVDLYRRPSLASHIWPIGEPPSAVR